MSCCSGPEMNNAPTVFAQIMAGLDATELARAAARFPMPRASKTLRPHGHFAAMVFAQLTYRESLRGIEACLNARPALAYHRGIRGRVTRTNLAYANEHRDWRVFAEVAGVLMRRAQRLSADTPPALGLEADLFALDATVIELSLALFPWARWQRTLASVKLNVLLDLRGDIPVFPSLPEGKKHEVASLDELPVRSGSYYVMDRGYLDFSRLHRLHQAGAFFVTAQIEHPLLRGGKSSRRSVCRPAVRPDHQTQFRHWPDGLSRQASPYQLCGPGDRPRAGLCHQSVRSGRSADRPDLPPPLGHRAVLSLDQTAPAPARILQHCCNGVRVQIWSAICACLLVAIARRRLNLPHSLWEILQIVSIASMEQIALPELLVALDTRTEHVDTPKQLEINYS